MISAFGAETFFAGNVSINPSVELRNATKFVSSVSKFFPKSSHCHPVLANVAGCKLAKGKHMRMKNDVSDSVSLFSAAAELPNWRHAHWKTDFFATHRMDSPRAISPLCHAL